VAEVCLPTPIDVLLWWSNHTAIPVFTRHLLGTLVTVSISVPQHQLYPIDTTPRRRRRPVLIGYQTPLVSNPTIASSVPLTWLYLRMHVPPMSSDDLGEAGDYTIRCALPRRPQTRCVAINRSNPAQLSPESLSLLVAGTCEIAAP
jgi:hypothetical protein